MIVSDEQKFIYVRIPKTASTSVSTALEPYRRKGDNSLFGKFGRWLMPQSTHPSLVNFRAHSHWGLQAAREILGPEYFFNAVKFTVARHPFSWITSYFNHVRRMQGDPQFRAVYGHVYAENLDLNGFVRSLRTFPVPPQTTLLIDYEGEVLVDQIARIERLTAEISPIFAACGIDTQIPVMNTGDYDLADRLSAESKRMVQELYAVDFEFFGYDSEGPLPHAALRSTRTPALGAALRKIGAQSFSPWERL